MERIPLRLKTLSVSIEQPWKAKSLSGLSFKSKYVMLQAHQGNAGGIYLQNDGCDNLIEGLYLKPGHPPLVFDIDTDRLVGMDLSNLFIRGGIVGDKLVVAYLEENNG